MLKQFISIFLFTLVGFLSAQSTNRIPKDTMPQNDSFRTIQWMADSFARAIMKKKPAAMLSLFPQFGTYSRYHRKMAPEINMANRASKYVYFKSRLVRKQKKLRKQMKKEGLSFSRAQIQKVEVDSGMTKDSIFFCKVRVYYKKRKNKFLVECHGIRINDQWFLLDGFLFDRRDI
jgi:hypothetical protein